MTVDDGIPVIVNPAARSARSGDWMPRIRDLSPRVRLCPTDRPGHARELARGLASAGAPVVVAAGGDGTINEVVNGLAEAAADSPGGAATLGILATGTMNVFAAELGLPGAHRLTRAWEIIERGNRRSVDLWQANERFFVQLAGVGLDAEIIRGTSWEQKKLLGPLSYVVSAAHLLAETHRRLRVRHPQGADVEGVLVLLGSGQRYGGPFRLFRSADPADGLLDVIVLKEAHYVDLLELLTAASFTGFENCVEVEYFQAETLEVVGVDDGSASGVPVQVDGDLAGETPVVFRPAPRRLDVIVP